MAEETHPTAVEATPVTEVVVTEATAPPAEEKVEVTEAPASEEDPKKEAPLDAAEAEEAAEVDAGIPQSDSFKEESNLVADLPDPEKKALDELKQLVAAAIANNEFVLPPPPPPPPPATAPAVEEPKSDEPQKTEVEPKNEETQKPVEPEETSKPAQQEEEAPPPLPPVEEKAVVVEDDGAKTVEAIEETVVPVAPTPAVEPPAPAEETIAEETATPPPPPPPEEVFIWGVPLLGDERSDTVLLKFLRAREFKPKDAMAMLKSSVLWRKHFGIDALLNEDLGLPEMGRVVFTHGASRDGHPVCYNVYGEFQSKELYDKAFGDEESRLRFLKWRIQYLEKGIRTQLDFAPGGVSSMVQVTDLKNSPGLGKHRQVTRQAVALLQDNYPEFIAKKVFINVPWWYLAFNRMMSPFLTQRTRSKFVFAGPPKSAEALFRYIAPEQVPVQFGGLSKEKDPDFTFSDAATEATIRPSSKLTIEFSASENSNIVWELRVLGPEAATYAAEFVPSAEDSYTVIVHKTRKLAAADEPVVKGSFKAGEPGKVVLTVDNLTSKKKKVLYRSKSRSSEST